MDNKMVIENLETQMTEILIKMNTMSSIKDLYNYNSIMNNDNGYTVDFIAYKSLLNVLTDILDTYCRLYRDNENKRSMRKVITNVKDKLNEELILLNEVSKIALKDTNNFKQYKYIMFCYNNIIRMLGNLERDIKDVTCVDCNKCLLTVGGFHKCYKYDVELQNDDKGTIKLDDCVL